jgi:hypothetical protein
MGMGILYHWDHLRKACSPQRLLVGVTLSVCAMVLFVPAASAETITGASLATCSPAPCQKATEVQEATLNNVSDDDGTTSTRSYGIERPRGLTGAAPAVLVFYGGNQCGVVPNSRFGQLAAAERFVVVYMAVPCERKVSSWEKRNIAAPTTTTPDDEPYVGAVVKDVTRCPGQCVDSKRVYAAGMSSGGSMVADVMCDPTNSPLFRGFLIDSSSLELFEGAPNCPSTNRSFFAMLALSNYGADEGLYYDTAPKPHLDAPAFAEWAANRLGCGGTPLLANVGSPSATTLTYTYAGPCAYATAGSPAVVALGVGNGSHGWQCQDSDPGADSGECTAMPEPPGLSPSGLPLTNGLFVEERFWDFVAQGVSSSEPAPPIGQTQPPLLSIAAPVKDANLAGRVAIQLTATSAVGITNVRLALDGAELGRAEPVSGGLEGQYSMTWDTEGVSNGSHVLRAAVIDKEGNTTVATVPVTVQNPLPTIAGVPADFMVQTTLQTGAIVTYALPTANDSSGRSLPVACNPQSETAFPLGQTTVRCVAHNNAGNANASFRVTVLLDSPPVEPLLVQPSLGSITQAPGVPAPPPGTTAPEGEPAAGWLALGDDWAAGAGSPPYIQGTDGASDRCRRAASAYPTIAASQLGANTWAVSDHACAGARVAYFYEADRRNGQPSQLSWVDPRDDAVTVSVGWNDTSMPAAVARCGSAPTTCSGAYGRRFSAALAVLGAPDGPSSIHHLLKRIAATVPIATVLAVGYARPFPPHASSSCRIGRLRFTPAAMHLIDDEVRRLDRVIQRAAAATHSEYLAGAYGAFSGHELCTAHADLSATLLPNLRGQKALARLVAHALSR